MKMLKRFARDTSGNIALAVGIAAIPLFAAAGAAVDFSGQSQTQAKLQAAVDAGALAGATSGYEQEARIKNAVIRFAKANSGSEFLLTPANVDVEFGGNGEIMVTATSSYPTTLLKIAGIESLPVTAFAQSNISAAGAEIAMVLDVTGSMAGAKIDALKVAAEQFVTETTKPNATRPDAVKLSIVPYAKYVNVGLANRNATWMDVPADYTETNEVCQDWTISTNPRNCRNETFTYTSDGVDQTGTREVCDYDTDSVNECRNLTYSYVWNGCAGSREYPWNTRDERPDIDFPGLLNTWCPNEITPLTSDADLLKTNINALNASGDTYIPTGLMWGWRTLTSEIPYTEGVTAAEAQSKGISKHIVLMTDGENVTSKSTGSGHHDGWNPDDGDNLTSEICTNIKAAGITIHAIAFGVTDADTKTLLQGCANAVSYYYDAASAVELSRAFQTIAGKINMAHLSK
jgi:Flp pilus assembly protein TadG